MKRFYNKKGKVTVSRLLCGLLCLLAVLCLPGISLSAFADNNSYIVSFDTNGGAAIEPITVTVGEKYGTLPTSAITGLSGNWYLVDENGTVTNTQIKKLSIVETERNHTLFVKRKVSTPTLKLTLKVPGAISDSYQYYIPGNSTRILTVEINNYNNEVLDYTYKWYKDGVVIEGATAAMLTLNGNVSDAGTYKADVTAKLKDGSNIKVESDSATASKEIKVKIMRAANALYYDANGGEGGPSNNFTGSATATVSNDTPSKKGYSFSSWNTKADGSGDAYLSGSTYTFTGDKGNGGCVTTLYAKWTPLALTGTVTISGTAKVGETLTASVTDTNNTGTLKYQWYRHSESDIPIEGATGSTYTVTIDDVDYMLFCLVTSDVQTSSIGNDEDGLGPVPKLNFEEGEVFATDYTGVYDGKAHSITLTTPVNCRISYSTDGENYSREIPTFVNAGTYTVYYRAIKDGYRGAEGSATVTIKAKPITVTADSLKMSLGSKLPELTYTVTGLVGNDTLKKEAVLTVNADTNKAGEYEISVSGADAGENYTVTYVAGTLTVENNSSVVPNTSDNAALYLYLLGLTGALFLITLTVKKSCF